MTDDASPAGGRSQIVTGQITIIGVGLIGGSFALALRAAGLDSRFIAYGRNEETLRRAVELKIVDDYSTSIACLLYTSPSPRDRQKSRMPSSA